MPRNTATVPIWLPVSGYALLAFLFSGVLLQVQPELGIDPDALSLVQFGPAIAALVVWLLWRSRLRTALPASVSTAQVGAHTGLLLGFCALFGLCFGVGVALTGGEFTGFAASGGMPFALYLLVQFIGAAGEEIGWRGQMQPLLETRVGRFGATLLTGLVWALWHVHAFTMGVVIAVSFTIATVSMAVLLGYLSNGSFWQRVWVATVGHWLLNITLYVLAGNDTFEFPQASLNALAALITAAAALFAFRLARRRRAAA